MQWRTSTHTSDGANCVEVGEHRGTFYLRDSTDRAGPTLIITYNDWINLLSAIRSRV
ncbi:DUF397 domain-containing protein [Actinomadura spongiicola]|uniref:DUF397 domain-containing protein n=1 Tax=Actinomadura spongiicola TaxID=2303421 RepID=UPI001313F9CC